MWKEAHSITIVLGGMQAKRKKKKKKGGWRQAPKGILP